MSDQRSIRPDENSPDLMYVVFQDGNGKPLGINGFQPSPVWINGVQPSRVEGYGIALAHGDDTLIITLDLEQT